MACVNNTVEEMSSNPVPTSVDLPLSSLSANICAELASGLSDAAAIKRRYELTEGQWKKLKANPVFRNMLRQAMEQFHGDMNAGKRITVKAEVALEDSIPLLYAWAHDTEIAISNRLEAIKEMRTLAGRNGREATSGPGGGGGGFNVNIVVQGHARREEIDVTSSPVLEGDVSEAED